MASIYDPRFRALDANAEPVSGAGMWVFDTGTTTPADIFTDEGLTTPASNPLTSDANGYFPQFFIASQSVVDIQVRQTTTITSTLLWSAVDVDSLGTEGAGEFLRDFGANGRLQARGASGRVQLEAGDPDGDDIGGNLRIGGWSGTTGESVDLDFDEITFPNAAFSPATAFQTLTDGATVNWDTSLGVNAKVTLGGNRTIAEPTNLTDGYSYTLAVIQDGTGSRTVTWNAIFDWGTVGTPALSTGAGKVDFVFAIYFADTGKLHATFRKAAA